MTARRAGQEPPEPIVEAAEAAAQR
jgi:hypothetical protein